MNHEAGDNLSNDIATTLQQIDNAIIEKIKKDSTLLIELADEMAERATMFEGQGYKSFLESRAKFVDTLRVMNTEYAGVACILKSKCCG